MVLVGRHDAMLLHSLVQIKTGHSYGHSYGLRHRYYQVQQQTVAAAVACPSQQ